VRKKVVVKKSTVKKAKANLKLIVTLIAEPPVSVRDILSEIKITLPINIIA